MSKNQIIGKETNKNGIKTFELSSKEIELLKEMDIGFKVSWNRYIQKTSPEFINTIYDQLIKTHSMLKGKQIPNVIREKALHSVNIRASSNCEGNITFYPHRDLAMTLITAYKFSVIQNYSVDHSLGLEYDYNLLGYNIELIMPHANLENKLNSI